MDDLENKDAVENTDDLSQGELADEGRSSTISFIDKILGKREGGTTEESIAGESITDNEDPFEEPEELEEEADQSEPEETEEPEGDDSEEWEEVDSRFVDAAREYGWDDAQIKAYAEKHDEAELVTLTGLMERESASVDSQLDEIDVDSKEGEDTTYDSLLEQLNTMSQDEKGSELAKTLTMMVRSLKQDREELNSLKSELTVSKTTREKVEWDGRVTEADDAFDKLSADFPELGKSNELKKLPDGTLVSDDPAVKARVEIFDEAVFRFTNKKEPWNKALKNAVQWYRGGHESAVEDKVLKKIKKHESRITPQRHRRQQTQQYATEIDRKKSVINGVLAKYGEHVD